MTDLAKEAGLGRESLYKSLSSDGNPSFATVIKVLSALGVKLHATSADADRKARLAEKLRCTSASRVEHLPRAMHKVRWGVIAPFWANEPVLRRRIARSAGRYVA